MRFKAALRSRLPSMFGVMALLIVSVPAQSQDGQSFTISGEDGYGIAECMHVGSPCGRVIADSWCESHGHAHALAYGMGGDVTGSVKGADDLIKVAAGDVVIRCGD